MVKHLVSRVIRYVYMIVTFKELRWDIGKMNW